MKINSDLGYEPVTYSELTQDDAFWQGCRTLYEELVAELQPASATPLRSVRRKAR